CTEEGLAELAENIRDSGANRVVIGACRPLCAPEKKKALARAVSLLPELIEIVDLRSQVPAGSEERPEQQKADTRETMNIGLEMAIARAKVADPAFAPEISTGRSVLVIGGGIAGMTAALGVADHGYGTYLVEKADRLGGNLNWLHQTIEGDDIARLAEQTRSRVENHPMITIYTNTRVTESRGTAGAFTTTLQTGDDPGFSVQHGAAILATGGGQAETEAFGRGTDDRIITQQELESRIRENDLDPEQINSMCMILCAGTRQPPKNYCSRICCTSALKHALHVKEKNPEAGVYVLYRDMMAYGFLEAWFTRARKAGVIFIAYTPETEPAVSAQEDAVRITATEPVIQQEVEISANLLVLATGIEPAECGALARSFGADTDEHGFFREAEPKWQPVGSLAPGVYACGIGLRPASIAESVAAAEAAAQQAVILLARDHMPAPKNIARVRHSLCSLCQNCIAACAYGARTYDRQTQMIIVDPEACRGCGACASACPNFAAYVEGFAPGQMLSMLAAAADH
ncbi:MAG: CoB--CoM heterodisulfide reductase iron-sulfur subunit A family protein, partial [Desulfobacterales bacterium]|nr:CoB--CoM heterodisulfide reductase iron-sulfur subunit A family protein [Desulfobacterales bacterium]